MAQKPGDEIDVREIGNSRDDDTPGPDSGEGVQVGFETTDIICKGQFHYDIKPVPARIQRLDPQRFAKTRYRVWMWRPGSAGKSMLILSTFCWMAS